MAGHVGYPYFIYAVNYLGRIIRLSYLYADTLIDGVADYLGLTRGETWKHNAVRSKRARFGIGILRI